MSANLLLYGFKGNGRRSSVYYAINQIENFVLFLIIKTIILDSWAFKIKKNSVNRAR